MRILFFVIALLLSQSVSARVRHFTSPEIKGTHKATLDNNGTLICFWKYERTPTIHAGLVSFNIVNNQLVKTWEDNDTFFMAYDFDTGDLNRDSHLDFVVAGSGYDEHESYYRFIAFYLSTGPHGYVKRLIARPRKIAHLAVGDIDGDKQPEVVFIERTNPMQDWVNLELKIGTWRNGTLSVRDSGIFQGSDVYWTELNLDDVDKDGKAEALVSTTATDHEIRIYDLDPTSRTDIPTYILPRQEWYSSIAVNTEGQILELGLEFPLLSVSSINNGRASSKIATREFAEIDFAAWQPMRLSTPTATTTVVLSRSIREGDISRQISIYDNGD